MVKYMNRQALEGGETVLKVEYPGGLIRVYNLASCFTIYSGRATAELSKTLDRNTIRRGTASIRVHL